MAAGDRQGTGTWHSQGALQEVPSAMVEEVWPSQHKVGDQMSPDYVPLKSKQSPRFRTTSLRLPSWKLAPIQNLTTAGLPVLGSMCLAANFTWVLLIGSYQFNQTITQRPKALCSLLKIKRPSITDHASRLVKGVGTLGEDVFSLLFMRPW